MKDPGDLPGKADQLAAVSRQIEALLVDPTLEQSNRAHEPRVRPSELFRDAAGVMGRLQRHLFRWLPLRDRHT